jgi:hypothetical protein
MWPHQGSNRDPALDELAHLRVASEMAHAAACQRPHVRSSRCCCSVEVPAAAVPKSSRCLLQSPYLRGNRHFNLSVMNCRPQPCYECRQNKFSDEGPYSPAGGTHLLLLLRRHCWRPSTREVFFIKGSTDRMPKLGKASELPAYLAPN